MELLELHTASQGSSLSATILILFVRGTTVTSTLVTSAHPLQCTSSDRFSGSPNPPSYVGVVERVTYSFDAGWRLYCDLNVSSLWIA